MKGRRLAIILALVVAAPFGYRTYNRAFRNNSWRAHQASVRGDLLSLAAAESVYHARSGRYAADLPTLGDSLFRPSEGVTIQVTEASATSFRAIGTHAFFRPDATCILEASRDAATPPIRCDGFTDWLYRPRTAR